jgi:hypothetical protein
MLSTRIAAAVVILWTTAAFAVQQPTTTQLYLLSSAVDQGNPVTTTAVVQGSGGPSGSVVFTAFGYGSPVPLGTFALVNGSASCTTSSLPAGSFTVQANYQGDAGNQPSAGTSNLTVRGLPAGVTTVSPSHLPAGTLDSLIWITGSNFQATTEVLVNGTVVPSIEDSPTQLRAFLPASRLASAGTITISVRNAISSLSVPVPPPFSFTVDAPGPAPLSIALSGSQATASHLTPGGNSAWLVATRIVPTGGSTRYENSWLQVLPDADSDGSVVFDTAIQTARVSLIPPDSFAAVVDVQTGAFRVAVPAGGHRNEDFFPIDAVQTMKGNDAARLRLTYSYPLALLVRPGVGAWSSQVVSYPDGFVPAYFRALPGGPPPPATFQADDVFIGMSNDRFVTARLGDYFPKADPSSPFLTVEDAQVVEGNSGFTDLNFDLRLSSAASSRVTVQFATVNGDSASATPGTDFEALTTTVTFEPGDVLKTVPVRVYGETLYEYQETLDVALSNASGSPIRLGAAKGFIVNDDTAPTLSIADAPAAVEDTNGRPGTLTFHVTQSEVSGATTWAYFSVPDGAATWEDVGDLYQTYVSIDAGSTSANLSIPLYPDDLDEDDEELNVHLYQVFGALPGRLRAVGVILDNDPAPILAVDARAVREGTGSDTVLQIPLDFTGNSARPMSVDYQVVASGSASASDVVVGSGTVSINNHYYYLPDISTFPVTIKADALAEAPETFTIVFSHPVNVRLPQSPSVTVTIADDDGPAGAYSGAVLHDAPEAYYRLDEASGEVAHDASGHGYDGTYGPDVTLNFPGALGSGDPAIGLRPFTYTSVPGAVSLPGTWGGPSWTEATLEGWVQWKPSATGSDTLNLWNTNTTSSFVSIRSTVYGSGATIFTDAQPYGFGFSLAVPAAGWHYLAVVVKSGASALYVDGVPVATAAQTFGYLTSTITPQTLGGTNGVLDEVAIYHRALTAADIARHYAARADRRVAADFDGNGSADVVLRNPSTGANALWLMNGTSYGSTLDLPWLPSDFRIEGAADFDADGQTDFLLRNYANGNNALWLMNGTAIKTIVNLPWLPVASQFRFEGTSDMNGDGSPDILIRNYTNGNNAVWLMNGTTFTGVADLPALPDPNYRMAGGGDFNADGKADIVWRNQSTGNNAVWLMNGLSLASVANLPPLANTAYRFNAIADYDGDGRADVVLRNYTTGANAIWLLNGVALKSVVNLPALTNLSYEIMGPR